MKQIRNRLRNNLSAGFVLYVIGFSIVKVIVWCCVSAGWP